MDLERSDNSDQISKIPKNLTPDNIRVSDGEREQVVSLLGQAAGEGRLTLDEYTDRVDQAYASKTRGELAPLLADLPVTAQPPFLPGQPASQPGLPGMTPTTGGMTPVASEHYPASLTRRDTERLIAIFGEDSRRGRWIVPARVEVRAIFGGCELHFEDAQILHQVTHVEVTALFGGVTLFVPEGVDVRLAGMAVFGGKQSKLREAPRPGAPIIEIDCKIAFGGVEVRPPKRRWFAKD